MEKGSYRRGDKETGSFRGGQGRGVCPFPKSVRIFMVAVTWFRLAGRFRCTTLPAVPTPVRSEDNTVSVGVPTQECGQAAPEGLGAIETKNTVAGSHYW